MEETENLRKKQFEEQENRILQREKEIDLKHQEILLVRQKELEESLKLKNKELEKKELEQEKEFKEREAKIKELEKTLNTKLKEIEEKEKDDIDRTTTSTESSVSIDEETKSSFFLDTKTLEEEMEEKPPLISMNTLSSMYDSSSTGNLNIQKKESSVDMEIPKIQITDDSPFKENPRDSNQRLLRKKSSKKNCSRTSVENERLQFEKCYFVAINCKKTFETGSISPQFGEIEKKK